MPQRNAELIAGLRRLQSDFPYFASEFLKIRNKSGEIVPFQFNRAQLHIHAKLEEQLKQTGMVRSIILKGRQQGCSTLITGRFFWKTVLHHGKQTFILTHEQSATDNLFGMTNRYLENYPEALRPELGAANAKELTFSKLDSGYKVATAGNKGAGRSATAQYLLGSEVGFWPSADEHLAGIMQTVPRAEGTEIIFESTANGVGNVFHDVWQQGEVGGGGWQAIFVPWFWQPEYRAHGVELLQEDTEYGRMYALDDLQLMWRRLKISEMGGDERRFMREYPSTPAEAFSVSDDAALLSHSTVMAARKSCATADGAKIIGVDPARFGDDRTVIAIRQGRSAEILHQVQGKDTMQVTGMVVRCIERYKPEAVFVDVGGLGAGVVDRLRELGFKMCRGVNFGERSMWPDKYVNKRAEMWGQMKEWLESPPVQIPDDDALQADLCSLHYDYDSHGRLKLESKDDAKKRGVRSPDLADALALTWGMPVKREEYRAMNIIKPRKPTVVSMGY